MAGEKGYAPFIMAAEKDENQIKRAFVGFWVDDKGIQRPPYGGEVYVFYPLGIYKQADGSELIGATTKDGDQLYLPALFIKKGDSLIFIPPYTDSLNTQVSPAQRAKEVFDQNISYRVATATAVPQTPTEALTTEPTEKAPAEYKWQYSKDGRIYYNEAAPTPEDIKNNIYTLAGIFTVNNEINPETGKANTEAYWESMVTGLWTFNKAIAEAVVPFNDEYRAKAVALMKQFPTKEAFLEHARENKGPVDLFIPWNNNQAIVFFEPAIEPIEGVDLSTIALSVEIKLAEEIKDSYTREERTISPFIEIEGKGGKFLIRPIKTKDGRFILELVLGKDTKRTPEDDPKGVGRLPLYREMDGPLARQSLNQILTEVPYLLNRANPRYAQTFGSGLTVMFSLTTVELNKSWYESAANSPYSPIELH